MNGKKKDKFVANLYLHFEEKLRERNTETRERSTTMIVVMMAAIMY